MKNRFAAMPSLPRLLFTMGDVAGIGPEIIARAWPELLTLCRPIVVGDPFWLQRALDLVGSKAQVVDIRGLSQASPSSHQIPCLACPAPDLAAVAPGKISAAAGRAAYDFLCAAIDVTLAHEADAIVTCPLHKEGLQAAGLHYPGHTEIIAERTGTRKFGMMLYARSPAIPHGLGDDLGVAR